MRDLAESGMTMVVVTHEMGFAREVADQILVHGEWVHSGNWRSEEFFAHPTSPGHKTF